MKPTLSQRLAAEFLGTAGLLMAVVGSGIMGDRLSAGNVAIALLANSVATGAALVALILTFGNISGAHLNPAVTINCAIERVFPWKSVPAYLACQFAGAFVGVMAAHLMFGLPLLFASHRARAGTSQIFSESIATMGLLLVISLSSRARSSATPYAVAAYITGAYWFTSSTAFANPAVTLARSLTDTFAGIRLADVPGFWLGEMAGIAAAAVLVRWVIAGNSVQEVAHASEHHRQTEPVSSGDHVSVAD